MYTLWALLEGLVTGGAVNGIKGIEEVLHEPLVYEKTSPSSRTLFYLGNPPEVDMEGKIGRIRVLVDNANKLIRLDLEIEDFCILKEDISEQYPDLYFDIENSSAYPQSWSAYRSQHLLAPVLFLSKNQTPTCIQKISISYASIGLE